MNSFNKTKAVIYPIQALFRYGFPYFLELLADVDQLKMVTQ